MVTFPPPICYQCRYLFRDRTQFSEEGTLLCQAFPKGIPRKYFFGDVEGEYTLDRPEHRRVDPDQVGTFVFKPRRKRK